MPDTERELFESAMSNEPEAQLVVEPESPKEPEKPESKPDEGERARDEKGRFAPKEEVEPERKSEQAKEPDAAVRANEPASQRPVKEPDDIVPPWRLREEAESKREAIQRAEQAEQRAQAIERQMYQLQQQFQQSQQSQTPKPNLFENPEQWEQTQQQQFQSALQQQGLQISEQLARIKHGDELFDAADKAAAQALASGQVDPALAAVGRSQNPGMALVDWYKRKQALDRLGNLDPDKYVEQEIEKRMNDPQFLAKAVERARSQAQGNPGPATKNPVTTIPSLNRQTSAANSNADSEEESDEALFKAAIRR